jgi:hypothetical protein
MAFEILKKVPSPALPDFREGANCAKFEFLNSSKIYFSRFSP